MLTADPPRMKQYGVTELNTITPEQVAQTMAELVQEGQYPGGTILECASVGSRVLGTWNIDPPDANGTSVPAEVAVNNLAPIKEKMAKERGSKL